MKRLYLVRHGESEWNILKKIQGQRDTLLTKKGIKQAEKIANRLSNEKIDNIYSSDLKRAFKTAEVIGNKLKLKVNSDKNFREINFGSWEGITKKDLIERHYEKHLLWMKEPHKLKLEDAETLSDLQKRTMEGINRISELNPNKNILVVSHSAAIKTIIIELLEMDISYFSKMSLDNVSLSIIEFRDYNNVLKLFNDTCHLKY